MRKTRMLLAATILAVPMGLVTASPAMACKQQPCPPACKLVSPVQVSGTDVVFTGRGPIECYY
ncbi:MAG TPA: hypothetical protein VEV43_07170 [Actinomycetota bacterium]|nr:hypothetical protein [Actinomycetota bacterium]